MSIYTNDDIHAGHGGFEQAMRAQTDIPGHAGRISPGLAIGLLSAAMRSGMPADQIDKVIRHDFAHGAPLLNGVLAMYEGDDWDIHLWQRLPGGQYKLCTDLCRPGLGGWRYVRNAGALD